MSRIRSFLRPQFKIMKAVICEKYGTADDLVIHNVQRPTPKKKEVCIKIHCSAVTESDLIMRELSQIPFLYQIPMRIFFGITKPRQPILGFVLSGEIVEVGSEVQRFKVGDQVFGLTGFGKGAYAEYKCMKETDSLYGCLAKRPKNLSPEESTVAVYGGVLALQFLNKRKIQKGEKVLVYGASGTCGTMAVQIANHFGAEVHAVCSGKNKQLVESLGALKVYDYTKEDEINQNIKFDFILDAVGKRKRSTLKKNLKNNLLPDGKYVSIDDELLKLDSTLLQSLCEILEDNSFKIIIDKTYKLNQIKEAHKYVEKGHKVGGVVIRIC